ncbi:MAG: hypothetical protein KAT00_05795 [Planctomycetes bacterium]|nr:hypothetical protein [Planctomycetota bacterium]
MALAEGLAVGSLILSGLGIFGGSKAEEEAAERNAEISLFNAELIEAGGVFEERSLRRQQAKQLGNMRASFGASGVTLEGSPLDVLAESAGAAALDILTLNFNTELRAEGARLGAGLSETRASAARVQQFTGLASTALGIAGEFV